MEDLTLAKIQSDEHVAPGADADLSAPFDMMADVQEPDRSVRLQLLGTDTPYDAPDSVYMIYMKFNTDGKFIVKQVSERPFTGTLGQSEARLLAVAQGGAPTPNIIVEGINFDDIRWRRPHYLTFVIDNPGWKIHWGPGGIDDPLRFLDSKSGSTKPYVTENFSFFDATRVPGLGLGDAFRCINYFHRNQFGDELLNGDTQDYCFQIFLETPFAVSGNPNTHIVLIVDPDGQNQGPRT